MDEIPWADLRSHPLLASWPGLLQLGEGTWALVVGCGLGDDAELLASRGAMVTAFDLSPSAIAWCRRRFADSRVRYEVADLLAPPAAWAGAFGLVVEVHTLQALPAAVRPRAFPQLAALVAPGGTLLVVSRGREEGEPEGELPWPLARSELLSLEATGLQLERLDEFRDDDEPEALRFRATFRREAGAMPVLR